MDKDYIKGFFPLGIEPRECQYKAMRHFIKKYKEGKRNFLIRGETGSGKSYLGKAILNFIGSGFMATPSKLLQAQYKRDFKDMVILQGKDNYKCILEGFEDKVISQAPCKQKGFKKCTSENLASGKYPYMKKVCPYHEMLDDVRYSDFVNANFHSLYAYLSSEIISSKGAIIIDECHELENVFSDFISLNFKGKEFPDTDLKVTKNKFDTELFEEILETIKSRIEYYSQEEELSDSEIKIFEKLKKQRDNLNMVLSNGDGNYAIWNPDIEDTHKSHLLDLIIKPIYIGDYINKFFNFIKSDEKSINVFFSATVNHDEFCLSNGFQKNDMEYINMENDFPIENAPIVNLFPMMDVEGYGFNYKNMNQVLPKMVNMLQELILKDFNNIKILVHTHSGKIENYLKKNLCLEGIPTIYGSDYEDKNEMIEDFDNLSYGVLFSYSSYQGVDLPDDKCRLVIFCKTPYLPLTDPYIKARSDYIYSRYQPNNFYEWQTTLKIIQGSNRQIRNSNDWGLTIYLDNLESFFNRSGHLFDIKTQKRCNLDKECTNNLIKRINKL